MKSSKQMEEMEKAEVFADPTYDVTFKMLFGSEKNKILLVNFLNNILSFKGKDEIKDLNIINSSLIQEDLDAIESAVDVRCKTVSGEDISIEMQRRNEDYFLSRTQDYMGKLISSQVKKDEGKKYHIAMNKTYIVIISKAKLFLKDTAIEGELKGIEKGLKKGHWEGKVKGEISKIKFGIENDLPKEKIVQKLNYTKGYFDVIQEHLNDGHFDDTESVILGDLKSSNKMDIEYNDDFI